MTIVGFKTDSRALSSVATALPTIVAELQGGQNYSWVGRYVNDSPQSSE